MDTCTKLSKTDPPVDPQINQQVGQQSDRKIDQQLEKLVDRVIDKHKGEASALLQVLLDIQSENS